MHRSRTASVTVSAPISLNPHLALAPPWRKGSIRGRHDIDVLSNRTLVYGSLTGTLGGCTSAAAWPPCSTRSVLTGGDSQLVIVASTVAIAALFGPLRRRIQGFIDHASTAGGMTR